MSKLPEPVAWFRTEMYESCPLTFYYESHCHEDLEPLYQAATVTALQSRITELEDAVIAMRDEGIDKIMAMSEDQINALNRLEGSNPDDIARIGKQAYELARKEVENQKLKAELAEARKDAERHLYRRNCSMDERNRLDHYAGEALDQSIDAAIAAGSVK